MPSHWHLGREARLEKEATVNSCSCFVVRMEKVTYFQPVQKYARLALNVFARVDPSRLVFLSLYTW